MPIVLLVLWLVVLFDVWLPVVALVLLPSDWLPVVAELSMVTLERPRRSMFGLLVAAEPLRLFVLLAVEPVIDDVVPAEDAVVGAVDVEADGAMLLEAAVDALESGRQSWWTALFECCFAFPVALLASLPAFGCARPELPAWRLLHGGSSVFAVTVFSVGFVRGLLVAALFIVALLLPLSVAEGRCIDDVELVLCANAGAAIMAATASALTNWERIICVLLEEMGP